MQEALWIARGLWAERSANEPVRKSDQKAPAKNPVAGPLIGEFISADLDQVKRQMPFLTQGQAEDIVSAEQRFAKSDGFGVLFTNGTGTGKTFVALGAIKRLVAQGKGRILIVVPKQPIANDWVDAGKSFFGEDITVLKDTNDSGTGIVITTFANFGDNHSVVSSDWDAVFIDEAHYLTANQKRTTTKALKKLHAITMKDEGVL